MAKERIIEYSDADAPMAARALSPRKCPAIMVSEMVYTCWNSCPSSTGSENRRISRSGLPRVKSTALARFVPFMGTASDSCVMSAVHYNGSLPAAQGGGPSASRKPAALCFLPGTPPSSGAVRPFSRQIQTFFSLRVGDALCFCGIASIPDEGKAGFHALMSNEMMITWLG